MSKLLKKSRLTLAVVLLVQAVTMFFLFLTQVARRRGLANAFLSVAAFQSIAGGYLLWQWTEDEKEEKEKENIAETMRENPDTFSIPLDTRANEKEFK